MSSHGGAGNRPEEPTSYGLQPPVRPGEPQRTPQPGRQNAPHPLSPPVPQQSTAHAPAPPHPSAQAQPHPYTPTREAPQQQPPAQDPGAGRLIAGRYRLLSRLGHGGMGTVWRAMDETVGREVAVKEPRLPDHLPETEREKLYTRMRREATTAARTDHPAVVTVHDVAVVDGRPWIVMELVRGRSLGDILQEGTLGSREAARIGLEVLGALEAVHAARILHRDVKPDNVLLGHHDRVVLTDFGIAQAEGDTSLTDTGAFVGSPEYVAPERVLGQRPGEASDLWSLGVVLYAATQGVSPFRRSNTPATLQAVLNSEPPTPAATSGPLAEVIDGLLRKDPAQRLDHAGARRLLEAALRPPEPPAPPRPAPPRTGGVWVPRKVLLGAVSGLLAAVLVAWLVIADPFGGTVPDDWKRHPQKALGVSVSVPAAYEVQRPKDTDTFKDWVAFHDPSGVIRVSVERYDQENSLADVAASPDAQMHAENEDFRKSGEYDFDMPEAPTTRPAPGLKHQDRPSAENTVSFESTDTQNPRPVELRFFYYENAEEQMYRVVIGYPGKGDVTERGREVAQKAIEALEFDPA
ncbi:serine/threonine-protein kinase [Streptomyces sp. UH6]|uniref:serine/threonine-protein kinase n=1 Tax=Streptomyces sp. UH6 TaxID=2748379 RepID=UPI0015D4CB8D|nr:serine/threonine-protein kinase [Streptomyces sp. UH6]NYV73560.1 protein kinase [Streptomyces sp. UH6]